MWFFNCSLPYFGRELEWFWTQCTFLFVPSPSAEEYELKGRCHWWIWLNEMMHWEWFQFGRVECVMCHTLIWDGAVECEHLDRSSLIHYVCIGVAAEPDKQRDQLRGSNSNVGKKDQTWYSTYTSRVHISPNKSATLLNLSRSWAQFINNSDLSLIIFSKKSYLIKLYFLVVTDWFIFIDVCL